MAKVAEAKAVTAKAAAAKAVTAGMAKVAAEKAVTAQAVEAAKAVASGLIEVLQFRSASEYCYRARRAFEEQRKRSFLLRWFR